MTVRTALGVTVMMSLVSFGAGAAAAAAGKTYTLVPDEHGMALKSPAGQTLFCYMTRRPADTKFTANSVCCLYPVKTPSGEDVVEFAPSDHPHHRGVFLAWHAIDGAKPADFWGWGQFAPTKDRVIVHRSIKLAAADARRAVIEVGNDWQAEGETLIEEQTTIAVTEYPAAPRQGESGAGHEAGRVIDFDFRLTPKSDLTLKQTAFSGFCVKSRKESQAVYTDPKGEVKLAAPHHLKPETDWPAADWYDYSVRLGNGKTIGVAVVDHLGNPPSTWHNLAPIAMVNPCIVAPGPVKLKAGQPLRLRYRMVVHDGPAPIELLNRTLAPEFRRPAADVQQP